MVELKVVSRQGVPQSLRFDAPDLVGATAQARALGYVVLSSGRPAWQSVLRRPRRAAIDDVVVFVEQVRDLLGAGLSVIEAVETLRRGTPSTTSLSIELLERRLREGYSLSETLAAHGDFPELLVALVGASELTSDLPQSLSRFLEHQRRVAEIRHRVVSTSIYPLLLIAVGGAVLLFLLLYVMPRFARIFDGMTGQLPWSARAMVAWSAFLHSSGSWWLFGFGLLVILAVAAMSSPPGRRRIGKSLLEWGPLRKRLRVYFLARWYRTTGMLVEGGIPLLNSLHLANELLPVALRGGGLRVEEGVKQGLSPAQAHARADMATPVAEQLLLAGERTGDLGAVLSRIAYFHESEVTRSLERSMRALEPIVMVLIGLGVGIVVILMYLPIFELASAIQ